MRTYVNVKKHKLKAGTLDQRSSRGRGALVVKLGMIICAGLQFRVYSLGFRV